MTDLKCKIKIFVFLRKLIVFSYKWNVPADDHASMETTFQFVTETMNRASDKPNIRVLSHN